MSDRVQPSPKACNCQSSPIIGITQYPVFEYSVDQLCDEDFSVQASFELDRRRKESLHRQIYEGIRDAILSANLERGAAVPATRSLAEQLNVSRMTVVNAYDQLLAEGYLASRPGSGTFVSCDLPNDRKMVEIRSREHR